MQKLFGKRINKKLSYGLFAGVTLLVIGLIFGMYRFRNLIFKVVDVSDNVAVGSIVDDIESTADNLNQNVSSKVYTDDMCVHFLNVGKADCAYIRCNDVDILIDAADRDPNNVVVEYLKRQNVKKLDMVVMTHPHRDHIGQMAQVLREFKVNKFIEADMPKNMIPTTWSYEKMLKALVDTKTPVESVSAGKNFELGDLKINILGPVRANKDNMNDNSVVMKMTYKDVSFLFTGDASTAEENDMVKRYGPQSDNDSKVYKKRSQSSSVEGNKESNRKNYKIYSGSPNMLKANVLKVGHHGSNSSSTKRFLQCVKPDYAVVSTVSKKDWGFPSSWRWRAIERVEEYCGNIYKTYECGNIIFLTDGKIIKVEKEK